MLESTFHLVLILAHVALIASIGLGFVPGAEEWVTVGSLFALVLFGTAGIGASNVVIITNSGNEVVTSQPAIGSYAYGLALLSGVLSVYATLDWLPSWREISNEV